MKKTLLAVLCAVFLMPMQAQAASNCYTEQEVKAEQLLRLHSELLIISLTCRQGTNGADLIRGYTGFTSKNSAMLHEAEETMERFYDKEAKGKGTVGLDKLRTRLANECGKEVVNESPNGYCASRRDQVLALSDSPPTALYGYAARLYAGVPTVAPVCHGANKVGFEGNPAILASFLPSCAPLAFNSP